MTVVLCFLDDGRRSSHPSTILFLSWKSTLKHLKRLGYVWKQELKVLTKSQVQAVSDILAYI